MPSIALQRRDVIVGVDTHKDVHVAVAIDGRGGLVDPPKWVATNPDGYAELRAWAPSLGEVHAVGVEGCGAYGWGLARFLRRHDHNVLEVARAPRKGARRLSGKNDPSDAEHAARPVLAGVGTATPKLANGQIEALRVIKIARDSAVKARPTAMISLKAVLVTASDELRIKREPRAEHKRVVACTTLEANGDRSDPDVAIRHTLSHLAPRWLALHEEIKVHRVQLKALTQAAAPDRLKRPGVGFDSTAELWVTAGDNTDRIRAEAAFAKLGGVCPMPAGAGKTSGRFRLNRGGNRQANAALYRIVRMRWHPPTIAYVERRQADGRSKRAIVRCLKRFVARELYPLLPGPASNLGPAKRPAEQT